ncbi:TonB-dependent receptor [Porticoccaceae bacterium]|nr:TonB-dependent receptor [Porticoccaceae bacterium]
MEIENRQRKWFSNRAYKCLFIALIAIAQVAEVSAAVAFQQDKPLPTTPNQYSDTRHRVKVPSLPAVEAFDQLIQQTGTQFLFPYDLVKSHTTATVNGKYTVLEALQLMLRNTQLDSGLSEKGAIKIFINDGISKNNEEREGMNTNTNTKKTLLAAAIGMFAAGGMNAASAQNQDQSANQQTQIDEIIVTANKREVRLQDTSIAISVLSEDTIEKRGLVDMNDYLATIPGASFIEFGATNKKIVLRGLSLGRGDRQNTASAYLGEIPISSAQNSFDITLVDIERIEVIKGPQGTLFGSNSLGGLVRTIPNAPNLNDISGNLKLDVSTQDESDDTNHSVTGVFNIPLIEDQLALRIAAYNFSEAGYVDIVSSPSEDAIAAATGATAIVKDDSNSSTNKGVRASLLWQPTENLKVGLVYGTQKNDVDNTASTLASLPGYQVSYLNTPAAETTDLEYSNLVIEYDFGWATLLSSSSVLNNESDSVFNNYPPSQESFFGPVNEGTQINTNLKAQEIRLVSNLKGQWEYVAGLFYEKSEVNTFGVFDWIGTNPMKPLGAERLLQVQIDLDYEQKAVFGEISYEFSEQWLLTLGGRHFQYDRVDMSTFLGGFLFNGDDSEEDVGESGNIYKANLAFTPNENTLIYAQWSEGFRLGRGQQLPGAGCDVEPEFGILDGTDGVITSRVESDTTVSLELGLKLSLLDNRLVVNTAAFKTDWDNLPTRINAVSDTCLNGSVINNIGSAESQGIEVDMTYLLDAWAFSLSASYMDTARTNTRPPLKEGERLAYAPRTNANAGLQYNFTMNGHSGFIRTDISYVGKYPSAESLFPFPVAGDYVDTSLHLGITMNHWDLTFYGTNLTGNDDARVFFFNDVDIRAVPRKLGVKVNYNF